MTEGDKLVLFNFIIAKIAVNARNAGFTLPEAFYAYINPFQYGKASDAISSFSSDGELLKYRTREIVATKVLLDAKMGLFDFDTLLGGITLAENFFAAVAKMGDAATQLCDYQRTHLTMALTPFMALANSAEAPFDFTQFGPYRYPENEFVTRAIDNALSPDLGCESASLLEFLRVRGAQIVVPEKAASILATLLLKKTPELLACFIKAGLLTHIKDDQLQKILVTALLQSQGILATPTFYFASLAPFASPQDFHAAHLKNLQALIAHFRVLNKTEVCVSAIAAVVKNPSWPNNRNINAALAAYAPQALEADHPQPAQTVFASGSASSSFAASGHAPMK